MIRVAGIAGFLAVTLGAFGAHGLEDVLMELGTKEIWQTATLYHLIHTVVLLLIATMMPSRRICFWCFLAGILIFSGSLYILSTSGIKWLGAITPIGGLLFLAGWSFLILGKTQDSS